MGVAALFVSLCFALAPVGKTGAEYDAEAHTLVARAAAAADPRAPSADVARVKAERTARAAASAKLKKALTALGWHGEAEAEQKLLEGATSAPDYGADGSVVLTLTLSTEALKLKAER